MLHERRWRGRGRFTTALLLACMLSGCGQDSEITVHIEEAPATTMQPQAALPSPPPPKPLVPPVPQPPAVAPMPPRTVAAPAAASSTAAADSRVPHAVAVHLDAPFFPKLLAAVHAAPAATSPLLVQETASRDGFGAAGKFGSLTPGEYWLIVTAPLLPGYPMLETTVVADGRQGTVVRLGWVQFYTPAKGGDALENGVELEVLEHPSRRPVYKGRLGAVAVEDLTGASHKRVMILPMGAYTFGLTDLAPGDAVSIAPTAGSTSSGLVVLGEKNSFKLTGEQPRAIVDLRAVLVIH